MHGYRAREKAAPVLTDIPAAIVEHVLVQPEPVVG